MFRQNPQSKALFGYSAEADVSFDDQGLKMHAILMIQMLDTVIEMLGPDSQLVSELLHDLGAKHKAFGVHPKLFDTMGACILNVFENALFAGKFGKETREAWEDVYSKISQHMSLGYAKKRRY